MKGGRDERGMALMLALLFVVLLTVIVVEFCYETQVEGSLAEHYVNQQYAYVAAKSAVAKGMNKLAIDIDQTLEGMGPDGVDMGGEPLDTLSDEWATVEPPEVANEAMAHCLVADEYGKINLNALRTVDPELMPEAAEFLRETLRALFAFRGTEEDPVDAILDWLDTDDNAEFEGAEGDYYEGLDPQFGCKDTYMHSVEELLLIPGITPEIFWGDPEQDQLPLTELLTVHGHPEGKININTAARETLEAVGEGMVPQIPDLAEQVMNIRGQGGGQGFGQVQGGQNMEGGYFTTEDEIRGEISGLAREPGRSANPNPNTNRNRNRQNPEDPEQFFPFVVDSYVFRVRGHGLAGESVVRIEAYVWRNNGQSQDMIEPFRILDWRVIR
jgi:general secretion pathway protein K